MSTPKAKKVSKSKTIMSHPPVASMVNAAITSLAEKKGSSLAAIKKYIEANYKVDMTRTNPFIRRYLKSATEKNAIVQLKGSYKLSKTEKKAKPNKGKTPKKATGEKPTKKVAKKTKKVKKASAEKKPKMTKTPKKPKAKKVSAKKVKSAKVISTK